MGYIVRKTRDLQRKEDGLFPYMQKTCDVAEKAILAKKKLRKKCVNRDKM